VHYKALIDACARTSLMLVGVTGSGLFRELCRSCSRDGTLDVGVYRLLLCGGVVHRFTFVSHSLFY